MNEVRFYYRPPTKLRQGNVFTIVCQSFCSQEGVVGLCLSGCLVPCSFSGMVSVPGPMFFSVGLCPAFWVWGFLSRGSLSGRSLFGGLCPGGSLSRGSLLDGNPLRQRPMPPDRELHPKTETYNPWIETSPLSRALHLLTETFTPVPY